MSRVDVTSVPGWAEACSSAFVPLRVRSAAPRFSASLQQRVLTPDVSLTRVASAASEVYRNDRLIAQHPREDLLISLHRTGRGSVTQHGREAPLRAGSAALYDASSPYRLAFPARMSEVVLQMPRLCIPADRNAFADLTARPLPQGGPLRALTALAVSVDARVPGEHPLEDATVADALLSLLSAIVSSETAFAAPRLDQQLLLRALRQFIDDHLTDPRLTPEFVAHHHHMSLRQVQKLFAANGDSPAAFIRRRRLEAARRLLLTGESVTRAGHLTGFNNTETFSRAFKGEFGMPPSAFCPSAGTA